MMRHVLATLGAVLVAAIAPAQVNRCAECHFANYGSVPAARQLGDWGQSAHARHGVGCERCHGGDPTTYQPVDAHRGILRSRDPLSPVGPRNIALTCASCHAGVVASFRFSTHAARAEAGVDAPTCTTCHRSMAAEIPGPAQLDATCGGCHVDDPARAAFVRFAAERATLESLDKTLFALERAIPSVDDATRSRLAAELVLARAGVHSATDALHTFDLRTIAERRSAVERRTREIVNELLPEKR